MPASRISNKLRARVTALARGYCEYCLCPSFISHDPFSIDHILPQSKGGKSSLINLAFCCLGCNYEKRDKTTGIDPLTLKQVRLFNPRRQRWTAHFGWNHDFTRMIGLTPTGRTTIAALDLNRIGVINLRKLLRGGKKHPPN
jgi:hypothetical protein